MKTERSSRRTLVGALIIVLAAAGAWTYKNRQDRRAETEAHSLAYQQMPVLKACGVHLTANDEHMLSHHKSVAIPFGRLDKKGRAALLAAAEKEVRAKLHDQRAIDAVLAMVPKSLVGFQRSAPGSAYVYINEQQYLPLHMVPGTEHVEEAHIQLHGHGETEHGQSEREREREPGPEPHAPAGGE